MLERIVKIIKECFSHIFKGVILQLNIQIKLTDQEHQCLSGNLTQVSVSREDSICVTKNSLVFS